MNYELLTTENAPVKMWTKGVPVEADARQQLINTAKMPFIFKHIAVMPDVHPVSYTHLTLPTNNRV